MQTLAQFDKSLALTPPRTALAEGYMHRNRGLSDLAISSFRSRLGSALIHALNAHSIFYFADIYHYGVGTDFYRGTVSQSQSLSGNRLSFSRMPPVAGIADYLFISEGSAPFKIDASGNITDWGFAAPASDPSAAAAAGGALADAEWSYQITYYNSATGHRSNGNGTTVSATTSGGDNSVALTNIPDPTAIDTQITHVEIWRSVAGGSALFYLTRIAAGTTSYTDDGSVSLSSTELPTDNLQPYDYFTDNLGPYNASMFWITNTESGQRGRLFYSPIGRAESLDGFIEITSDDAPLHRIFRYQGQLGVIGETGIFLVGGSNPYTSREIPNCPGTTIPESVAVTPKGVLYAAADGIRVFDGSTSTIVLPGGIERIIRGESVGDLTSFTPVTAAFCRNEYIVTDTSQSLAFDITDERWRDLGLGLNAIFYNEETDDVAVTFDSNVVSFESPGEDDDNGTAIPISIEPRHITTPDDRAVVLQHLIFDIDTNSNQITAYLTHDNTETSLGIINTSSREKYTINVGIAGTRFGIRLSGNATGQIELYSITFKHNAPTP